MNKTLVIQSHRSPLPYPWLESCLQSVQQWAEANAYEYRYLDDELFQFLSEQLRVKTTERPVLASDLARLYAIRQGLQEGYERVVWLDADFLIFKPKLFVLHEYAYALGREVWVQKSEAGRLKVYKKIHNAFLQFSRGNALLDFYIETAKRLLLQHSGSVPAQFIGPKLLTALHNIAQLPVLETAGMLSPLVVEDIVNGGGGALDLFVKHSPQTVAGANLCISSCDRQALTSQQMERLIELLLSEGLPDTNIKGAI